MIRSALLLSAAALMAAPAHGAQEMLQPVAHQVQDEPEGEARDPLADLLDDLDRRREHPAPARDDDADAGEDDPFGLEEGEDAYEDEPADQPNPFGFDPDDADEGDAPIETAPLDPDQDFDPLTAPLIDAESPEGAAAALGRPVELSSEPGSLAVMRGLDKVTARTADFEAPIGETVQFGGLEVTVQYCRRRPPEEPPEIFAFVQIDDPRTQTVAAYRQMGLTPDSAPAEAEGEPGRWLFSGWMFGSNPALNALEHPVYDVWVIDCRS
jgi:hypothetical protein